MRFTDRKTLFTDRIPLLSIRSIRTDRHMAYTDRYGAGVLDNPPFFRRAKAIKPEAGANASAKRVRRAIKERTPVMQAIQLA